MKNILFTFAFVVLLGSVVAPAHALTLARTAPSNGPVVSGISTTSVTFTLPEVLSKRLNKEQVRRGYFEYSEPEKACIMIYPTPAECLPKATAKGKTTITASNLKPNTKYSVAYKYDNTIRCIKDPCPENGFVSDTTTFTTLSTDTTTPSSERIAKRLGFGSWGTEVSLLQKVLVQKGFMTGSTTGYFGIKTMRAVKTFQASSGIPQTGFVGPRTQTALNAILAGTPVARGEKFSGTVEEVSTACFADGICSITVSGKKVITTVGWRQAPALGSITGVPSIGDAEKCIGAKADVYAEKEGSDYTLYGDNTYYVRIIGCGLD